MNGNVDFSGLGDSGRGYTFENLGQRRQALDSGRYESNEGNLDQSTKPTWSLPGREPRRPAQLPG